MASAEVDIPRRERPQPDNDDRESHHDRNDRKERRDDRDSRDRPLRNGTDSYRPAPRDQPPSKPALTEEQKQASAKAEYEKLLTMRSGGTYIPPARLRALQAQITDKTSKEYQRMAWEALKKSINGLINKVNTANIKHIVPELFAENLVRGRGLFCRSIMKAQAASLPFTPIYAAMAAIVNTKLPQVGELLVRRLVMQFRKGFKRNDKAVCLSSTTFIAHLINQQVQHEMLAGQILLLLLNKPTDDSVEIAVGFCKEVGAYLEEMQPAISMVVFDQFRNILHEADISKRTQYMIEVLFQVRKDGFKDNVAVKEELDLVEEEDQITHGVELEGEITVEDGLNIFKFDAEWEENEESYKKLKAEILGEGSDYDDDDDDDEDESSSDEEDEESKAIEIKDQSNADLVNLRRTIYLTIMSSADPEEAVHKLMKINLPAGQEPELPSMIVECCSQEKTYTKFMGLIGERFAKINRLWCDLFEQSFAKYYETIHRYETNKLRNIAQLFGHMFASDALGWHCFSIIKLSEDDTTASSRIFIKELFAHITTEIGKGKFVERMLDETLRPNLEGMFPRDNDRKKLIFSINYLISIGLGELTEESTAYLKNMPKAQLPAPARAASDSDSVSSYSSYTGSSYSRSRSRTRSRSRSRTPRKIERGRSTSRGGRRNGRDRSYDSRSRSRSRSYSESRSRSRSRSYTPDGKRGRRDDSYSRSPPRRGGRDASISRSRSRSPAPKAKGKQRARSASYSSYSRSPSRSRSPYSRRKDSRSPSPPRRGNAASRSPSPARGRGRSPDRGRARRNSSSPASAAAAPKGKRYTRSPSYDSRSPGPATKRARRGSSYSRSPSRSRSPERDGGSGKRRRGDSRGGSVSRSPPPMKRGRRGS